MDLSLNYNSVHFVEHSSFLDVSGLRAYHSDIFGSSTGADSEQQRDGGETATLNEEKLIKDEKFMN